MLHSSCPFVDAELCNNRSQLRAEYKRKIENMVRKPDREATDDEEPNSQCPFCFTEGPETELECSNCKDIIPFCVATGKRCIASDWARCPSCKFDCRAQEFIKILLSEKTCPMCNEAVSSENMFGCVSPIACMSRAASERNTSHTQATE